MRRGLRTKARKVAITSLFGALWGSSVLATAANNDGDTRLATPSEETANFNWARLSAEAHVAYVSSGWLPLAKRMIDGDATTEFSFSSSDSQPTAIIELSQTARLHRVTALYHTEEGRLEIYLLNKLSGPGTDIIKGKPIATATPVEGKATVDFDPRGARYVALRWIRKQPRTAPLAVAEVGAFAVGSNSIFDLVAPPSFIHSTIQMTSNAGPDFSNTLGTLAVPPTRPPPIAPVSP
jgi:hypothetical protein